MPTRKAAAKKRAVTVEKADATKTAAVKAAVETKEAAAAVKEAAKLAAQQEREKAAAAKKAEQEAKDAKAEKVLAPIAKEIIVRIEKAEKNEADAVDHRVSAALRLAEAEKQCKDVLGVNFKTWCEKNIPTHSFETLRKLSYAGASGDKEKTAVAIADMRAKNAAANKAHRAKKKAGGTASRDTSTPSTPAAPKQTPFKAAAEAVDKLDDTVGLELIRGKAIKMGMAVVPEKDAKAYRQMTAGDDVDRFRKLWDGSDQSDRARMIEYVEKKTGYTFVAPKL